MFPRAAVAYSDTHQVGCILEIMDILGLKSQDANAEGNIMAGIKARIPQDKQYTDKPAVATNNHYDSEGYCDNPARGY